MRRALQLAGFLGALVATTAQAQDGCVECHAIRSERRLRDPIGSVRDAHGRAGVGCAQCHGGVPEAHTARAHDPGQGFVGRPDAASTVRVCGRCHDGTTDAPDVLGAYRNGAHGAAVARGRPGATCTSCHVPHQIEALDPERALSRCVLCHAHPQRMRGSGLPTDQLQQWSQSVHGLLASAGDERAPRCVGCHDPHENRAGLAAAHACGRCHTEIRDAFQEGPHATAFARLGFLDCVECHGSHEVQSPNRAMLAGLGAVCARCHGAGQAVFERVRGLVALAERVEASRATIARDDRRRRDAVRAVHRLDPEALSAALDAMGPLAPVASPEGAPASGGAAGDAQARAQEDTRATSRLIALGGLLAALAFIAWYVLRRRRRG